MEVSVNVGDPTSLCESTRSNEAVVLGPCEHLPADPVLDLKTILGRSNQVLQVRRHVVRQLFYYIYIFVGLLVGSCLQESLDDLR